MKPAKANTAKAAIGVIPIIEVKSYCDLINQALFVINAPTQTDIQAKTSQLM